MRYLLRGLTVAIALAWGALLCAQTPSTGTPAKPPATTAPKPAPWKSYCQPDGGFCFKYPSSWTMMGDVFNGNGVVVAPPQKQEKELWSAITVVMVVPPPEAGEEAIGLDGVIQQATTGLRAKGQSFETLQRQQRTVDHKPAEMLKARYHDKTDDRDWIEELVFIEGPDDEIYSVSLKCVPQQLIRLEPVLAGVLETWRLPEPAPPADAVEDEPAQPQTTPKPSPTAPH